VIIVSQLEALAIVLLPVSFKIRIGVKVVSIPNKILSRLRQPLATPTRAMLDSLSGRKEYSLRPTIVLLVGLPLMMPLFPSLSRGNASEPYDCPGIDSP
jgi:hypothetical protein